MTVTDVVLDRDAHTLTLTADYRATVEQVWQLWADPRLLERWWGPPSYPATVTQHELAPGGRVAYFMTAPDGQQFHGFWRVTGVDAPRALEFEDAFADAAGAPSADLPETRTAVAVTDAGDGVARMVITSTFASAEAMEQLVAMGMQEGLTQAVGQTDDLVPVAAQS